MPVRKSPRSPARNVPSTPHPEHSNVDAGRPVTNSALPVYPRSKKNRGHEAGVRVSNGYMMKHL